MSSRTVDYKLPFGKYRGHVLSSVPWKYVCWLTHNHCYYDEEDHAIRVMDSVYRYVDTLLDNKDSYIESELAILPETNPVKQIAWWDTLEKLKTPEDQLYYIWSHAIELDEMQTLNGYKPLYRAGLYTWFNHQESILATRTYVAEQRLCVRCGKKLVPVANKRLNGVGHHVDWSTRNLHKKCYHELVRDTI